MEQSDLVFQKLKAKEKEYHDLEDEYLKPKLVKWMFFFKRDNTVTKMGNSFIGVYNN